MTDQQIKSIMDIIKSRVQQNSRSFSEYEKGKRILQGYDLHPVEYRRLIYKLSDWV